MISIVPPNDEDLAEASRIYTSMRKDLVAEALARARVRGIEQAAAHCEALARLNEHSTDERVLRGARQLRAIAFELRNLERQS